MGKNERTSEESSPLLVSEFPVGVVGGNNSGGGYGGISALGKSSSSTSVGQGKNKRRRAGTVPEQWRPEVLSSALGKSSELGSKNGRMSLMFGVGGGGGRLATTNRPKSAEDEGFKTGDGGASAESTDLDCESRDYTFDEESSIGGGDSPRTTITPQTESPTSSTTASSSSSSSATSSSSSSSNGSSHPPYTRQQWGILIVLYVATLTSSFAVCLFPPFFPAIAESKGAPASVYGFIIGTNCLTSFIVTPIFGKHLNKIGMRFAFVAGLFGSGGCCFLSGFLEFFPPGLTFVLEAIAIRVVHASANALVIVSTFSYIAVEFPHSVARIFSMTRAMMNVAQMLGPVVGGAMYEVGGFKMPFIVMGIIQTLMAIPSRFLLPEYETDRDRRKKEEPSSIFGLLAIPTIWIAFSNIIFSTMSNGFLSVTLEPQVLRQFDLSPFYVGLVFGLKDGANAAFSPVWGYLSDRSPKFNKALIFFTAALGAFSFVLLGPFPGLPIKETLTVATIALTLNGIAISGQQVAGMVDALGEAITAGYPDTPDTHGLVSGVWSSLSGGGRFISRCFAGVVVDAIGFRDASTIIVMLQASIAIVALGFFLATTKMRCKLKSRRMFISVGAKEALVCTTATPSEPVSTKVLKVRVGRRSHRSRRRTLSRSMDFAASSYEA